MKKGLLLSVFGLLIALCSYSQYFQGTFVNPINPAPPPANLNQLVFKMKPTGDITTSIGYMAFAFRYPTATTPTFSLTISNNTTNFPGLSISRLPDYVEGAYTYVRFVHNTTTIPSATYLSGVEKDVFTITLTGAADFLPMVEMASDLSGDNYGFGVSNGAGLFIDPGAGPQLYGPGFNIVAGVHLLPLSNIVLPIKFVGFNVTKKNDDAILSWQIENESSLTDFFEIERSMNGTDFKKLTTTKAKNNGNSSNSYEITDANLTSVRSSGIVYYRIKQVDKDGRFILSGIRNVRLNVKDMAVNVYPNPIKSYANLTIDLEQDASTIITINDATGKQVKNIQTQLFKGANNKKIDMANLSAGSYLLKVQTPSETKTLVIVKAN